MDDDPLHAITSTRGKPVRGLIRQCNRRDVQRCWLLLTLEIYNVLHAAIGFAIARM